MNFVLPMAGRGQRFIDAGFEVPKMLIVAKGKTLLEWSVDSLPLNLCTRMICIVLKEHEEKFSLSEKITQIYGGRSFELVFHFLDAVTKGQAETVWLARHLFDPNTDLLIYNIDTQFYSGTLAGKLVAKEKDGVLGGFESRENKFSFALTGEDGYVIETTEKIPISNNALTGLYHFNTVDDFLETAQYHFDHDIRVKNEFYIAPMYNYLIQKGKKYIVDICEEVNILGTPEELDNFLKK
ncbi:MAG: 2-C-methyl-D-erythritol 4-phosphate cytidylyltransferase [Chitinophagaceae bacterium]|nr:2-C-methyl-D-erythritol 4-phosphate cytidylyltransferase [Chitinophagaceae bacterium]